MTLNWQARRWHVRLYLWAEPIVAEFKDSYSRTDPGYETLHTNLCPYMRTLLVWLPMAFISNLLVVVAVATTTIYVPGRLYGWRGYFSTLVGAAVGIALLKLCFWVGGTLSRWHTRRENARESALYDGSFDGQSERTKVPEDPTPGFWDALRTYIRRAHDGVCPGITITRSGGGR